MAEKKKPANGRRKKTAPELLFEDGYYWMVSGTKRVNLGRNERYAQRQMAELTG